MLREKLRLQDGSTVDAMAPVIVSASRSTDIPAFYAKWFIERIKAGYVVWVNPFNRKPSYVSFSKTRVIVFWTKNPKPLLPYLDELDKRGINYYFQFTLNDYDEERFEPNVPSVAKRVETFKLLSERIGPDRVIWRYDPLIITPELNPNALLHRIRLVSEQLFGLTHKLVFSFIDVEAYRKVQNNLVKLGLFSKDDVLSAQANHAQQEEIANGLMMLRNYWQKRGWQYTVATCGEDIDFSKYNIEKNRCIDPELMDRCFNHDTELQNFLNGFRESVQTDLFSSLEGGNQQSAFNYKKFKDKGQRAECGCVESKDIGMYDTCSHNCVYCYANTSAQTVAKNRKNFMLMSESIIPFKIAD
ncbi:MAG: DUF1848 domain-containing protein [Succinivibrio sp.]